MMRRPYLFCWLALVFLCDPSLGEFNRTTSLIDIPTAYILPQKVVRFSINGSVASSRDPYPGDLDFTLAVGWIRAELALTALTMRDFAMDLSYQVMPETKEIPAVALGIQNIGFQKYISEVGRDSTTVWDDDALYPLRCPEQFSAFIVASKKFEPYGTFHLGLGRGRFVGYGPRSKLFNSDTFSDTTHEAAVGLFWGWETDFVPGFGPMVDFDGRDFNIGLKYRRDYGQIAVALAKLEHRLGSDALLHIYPRFAIGASANSRAISELKPEPTEGSIAGVVTDRTTNTPIMAVISFLETDLPGTVTDSKGRFRVELPEGAYKLECAASGYLWQKKEVTVVAGRTTVCNFSVRRKPKKLPRGE